MPRKKLAADVAPAPRTMAEMVAESEAREHCACPSCRVVVHLDKARCGHTLCDWCRREGHVCEACTPDELWTVETARDWLIGRYFSDRTLDDAEKDFEQEIRWLVSGSSGASGPHSASYQTDGRKIKVWTPISRGRAANPDFTFAMEALLREALARRRRTRATAAVAAGEEFKGAPIQAALF